MGIGRIQLKRNVSTVPKGLNPQVPTPVLAWSSSVWESTDVAYDFVSKRFRPTIDPAGHKLVKFRDYVGLAKDTSSGLSTHIENPDVLFTPEATNVLTHFLVYVENCGTNAGNMSITGIAQNAGFNRFSGIYINNNGIAGFTSYGSGGYPTPYKAKAAVNNTLASCCVLLSDAGTVTSLFINGELIGTGAYPSSWGSTPFMYASSRVTMYNASGVEPVFAMLQYATFTGEGATKEFAQRLSVRPEILWEPRYILFPVEEAGGDPTLLPPLLTNTSTLFSPVVTRGSVGISAPLLSNASALYSPAVGIGASTLGIPLLASTSTLYTPTITAGAVSIAPPLLGSSTSLFAPVVTSGASTVVVPLLSNASTLYVPSVSVGAIGLFAPLLINTNALYSATIAPGSVSVYPPLYANTNNFYAPVVSSGGVFVAPPLLSNASALYPPTIVGSGVFVSPPLLSNASVQYVPTITTGAVGITVPLFTNSLALYSPSVAPAPWILSPPVLSNTSVLYSATVTVGSVTLAPSLLSNSSTLYAPVVGIGAIVLQPPLIGSVGTLFAPVVTGSTSFLLPGLLTNASVLYTFSVSSGAVVLTPPLLTNFNIVYGPVYVLRDQAYLTPPLITTSSGLFVPQISNPLAPVTFDKISYWSGTAWVSLVRANVTTKILAVGDETTPITTGTGKFKFRTVGGYELVKAPQISLGVAQVSGSTFSVDIKETGASIFDTLMTIDNGLFSSRASTVAPVVNKSSFLEDKEFSVDVTQVGDGTAAGLKVYFTGVDTPDATPQDPFWSYVRLLLNFNGSDTDTTFTDSSPANKVATVVGNAQYSNTRKRFGSTSGRSDGVGDRLTWPSGTDFAFGTGDYAIELSFLKVASATTQYLFSSGPYNTGQISLRLSAASKLQIFRGDSVNALGLLTGVTTVALDTWYDVVLSRSAGVTTVTMNGVVEITSSAAYTVVSSGVASMFDITGVTSSNLNGYIDNFRMTVGKPRTYSVLAEAFPEG